MTKTFRDQGIVLRTSDLGEADRIITIATREHGKIRASAKGVRKTRSKFGARLEPFALVDLQLYEGRSLNVVTQAESINEYHRAIVADYDKYVAASALVEVADSLLSAEGEADLAQFTLLHGALHAMAIDAHLPDLIVNSYILRALSYSGWQLAVFDCAVCGAPGPHAALNVAQGGAVCENCRGESSAMPTAPTWDLLRALSTGDWVRADGASMASRRSAGAIISAYASWELERSISSLRFVESRLIA